MLVSSLGVILISQQGRRVLSRYDTASLVSVLALRSLVDMTIDESGSQAAYRSITSRTKRAYAVALSVNVAVGVMVSSSLVSALIALPSFLLAAGALLTGWQRPPHRGLFISALVVSSVTLIWSAIYQSTPLGSMGFGIAAGLWIIHQHRSKRLLALAACVLIIAMNILLPWLVTGDDLNWGLILPMMVFGVIWVLVLVEGDREQQFYDQLNRAKDAEREMSILRERNRFAADLHDIQGHTLHVIKLKAAVAARLQHSDPERAAAELAAIQRLTAETIEQSRSLAHSTHQLVLAAELANAVDLLEAASVAVQVKDSRGAGSVHEAAFALVLREGTTNVLRHSQADQVWVTITDDCLSIRNNGVAPGDEPALRGLATLRQRLGEDGGTLSVQQEGRTFAVTVSFARETV